MIGNERGFTIASVLSIMGVLSIISGVLLQVILTNFTVSSKNVDSQKAFNIAEAGINYYLWHLSHNATDFKDGKTTPAVQDPVLGWGPYVHNYIDDNARNAGTYTLWIKPQGNGSTIATIRSIGKVAGTNTIRTVESQVGAASFASYGLVSDSPFWFGETESANGPIHSNQGIRMDGSSNSDITSARATYVPPSNLGGNGSTSRPGVWCDSSIVTPVNCNTRSKIDWRYPVTSVDFNQVSGSLCTMKRVAFANNGATASLATQTNACSQVPNTRTSSYLPQRATNGTYDPARGYLIELNSNNTYNVFQVNGEDDRNTPYTSALTRSSIANNIAIPSSGVIFAEDNVWVRSNPTFQGRVTIASGRLATSSATNIVIADNLRYSTKNGSDAIGLVAEDDVIIAPYAPPASGAFNFEVNAATLSQTSSVTYPGFYRNETNRRTRGWVNSNQQFLFYGSVASRQTWTWSWLCSSSCGSAVYSSSQGRYVSGVLNNTTQYDYNLLYAPPPSFPITSGYNILSWREVLTKP